MGLVPGLTATLAITLLLPITYVLEITNSLVMAMGIFMAGMYSGSITGIIVNIPGSPGGAITTIEGHPLMQKGEGAKALTHDAFSSFVGGTVGVIILIPKITISKKSVSGPILKVRLLARALGLCRVLVPQWPDL